MVNPLPQRESESSTPTPPRSRLVAARASIAELANAERSWLGAHPFRLAHEHDMRAGRYRVRAHVVTPPPAGVLALVEAIPRELRAALDDAATARAGAPTRFPVFESLPLFAQRARKALARMPDATQAAIEALQPYHAIGGFRNGPLWVLDQLASSAPRLAAGAVRPGAELGVNTRRKVEVSGALDVPSGAFDDGATIAEVPTRIVGPDPKLDLFLRADFALAFARTGPARGGEVVEVLGTLAVEAERAIAALTDAG